MARIAGIDLPGGKRLDIALTYIHGIGRPTSAVICAKTGVAPGTKVRDLTDGELVKIREAIEKGWRVEGDLRSDVQRAVKRLIDVGSYRGQRHKKGLPVRGQRTKTNARTRKGPRKTIGASKKKEEAPK